MCNVRMHPNVNITHVANASTDLRLFNRVCVCVRLRTFAIVRLRELACDRIDTRATYFTLWRSGRINSARASADLGED